MLDRVFVLRSAGLVLFGGRPATGEIPDALAKLDKLEELDLGGNNLTGAYNTHPFTAVDVVDLYRSSWFGNDNRFWCSVCMYRGLLAPTYVCLLPVGCFRR